MRILVSSLMLLGLSVPAQAMNVQSKMLKPQASLIKNKKQKLFDFLDLKQKKIRFTSADSTFCEKQIRRVRKTFKYSCTLPIPNKAKTSQLRNMASTNQVTITVGEKFKLIKITVSKDAKLVTFSTAFESLGVDFEEAEFNSDLHAVFEKSASDLFSKAMKKLLVLNVLEN